MAVRSVIEYSIPQGSCPTVDEREPVPGARSAEAALTRPYGSSPASGPHICVDPGVAW